jgi:hypothetical protein
MAGFNFPNNNSHNNTFAELYRKYTSINPLDRFKAGRNLDFREKHSDDNFGKSA